MSRAGQNTFEFKGGGRSGGRGGGREPISAQQLAGLFDQMPPQSIEAEMCLIGSMILDYQVVGDVIGQVTSGSMFYRESHGAVFDALVKLYDERHSGDIVQLLEALKDRGVLDQVGGPDYIVELAQSVPSAANAPYYAKIVREKAQLRKLIDAAGQILYDAYHAASLGDDGAREVLDKAEQQIFDIAEQSAGIDSEQLGELLQHTMDLLMKNEGRAITGIASGFYDLDEMTSGLQPGELVILAARPSMGKAQPLDAQVLTSCGFVRMGDLSIGDELASLDGAPSRVCGIFPQGERQVYRVTLSDGRSTECCDEHLWRVHFRQWDEPRVLSTAEIRSMLERKRYRNRLWVEPFIGEYGRRQSLGLEPWLLGLLIGDGCLKGGSVRISAADPDIVDRLRESLQREGLCLNPCGGYDYRIVHAGGPYRAGVQGVVANPLKEALRDLGLWDRGAEQKFIPARVFEASRDERVDVLAGLIDSDGWVESFGAIRFATASRQLADDIVRLMRSLGGTGSWSRKRTFFTYKGERRDGLPAYVCNLQHPDPASLRFSPAKARRVATGRARQRRLNFVSIEPTRVCQTQCIAVTHPSRLYVTDGYIVTHNTALALNLAEQIAASGRPHGRDHTKAPVAFFSMEMSRQSVTQRLLCAHAGVDSHKLRTNRLGHDDFRRLHVSCGHLSELPIYVDDTPGLTVLMLRAKARRMVKQYGIKAVVIDYMQLMGAPGAAREGRQQEVSAISRGIKALARELNVPVVCLAQLNRGAEQREGHRPRMADLRESGSIEQDADVILLLHREAYYHQGDEGWLAENATRVNEAELIVAKQRNGPTGVVQLTWDGATTRFKNYAPVSTYTGGAGGGGYAGGGGSGGYTPRASASPGGAPASGSSFSNRPKTGPEQGFRDGGGPVNEPDEADIDDLPI